jgi:phosphoglucosamine mutase
MTIFPQFLMNVEIKRKPDLNTVPVIKDAIKSIEKSLGEKGRVLVRYSGTQQICRIMVEGPTINKTRSYCREIAGIVKDILGEK